VQGEGLLDGLAAFAGRIGGALGAIAGLAFAYDNSYGVWGYVVSLLVGGAIGGVVASLAIYGLALGIVLLLVVLVLRACGADIPLPF
jgi:L-cysteine desulfidase